MNKEEFEKVFKEKEESYYNKCLENNKAYIDNLIKKLAEARSRSLMYEFTTIGSEELNRKLFCDLHEYITKLGFTSDKSQPNFKILENYGSENSVIIKRWLE